MKLRILNYGAAATHVSFVTLRNLREPISISDFDAFIFDPNHFLSEAAALAGGLPGPVFPVNDKPGTLRSVLRQHVREITDLLRHKQGVVVCFLRPDQGSLAAQWTYAGRQQAENFGPYFLLRDHLEVRSRANLTTYISAGLGNTIKVLPGIKSGAVRYFNIVGKSLQFAAYFNSDVSDFGEVLATDSVGHAVALEAKAGKGFVIFLPLPVGVTGEKLGAALVQTIRSRLEDQTEITLPEWAQGIVVPGGNVHDSRILELRSTRDNLDRELDRLEKERDKVLNNRKLLYTTGKLVLEPAVRNGFRHVGMTVLEPDDYDGEWDLSATDPEGRYFVGEIEGPEGAVDVDKYRQLLDYVQSEVLAGHDPKGILIGNGYRSQDPAARPEQFTEHVLRGAARERFCLLPTSELFNAVCAVLDAPEDEALKKEIRDSLYATTGVWKFSRPRAAATPELGFEKK